MVLDRQLPSDTGQADNPAAPYAVSAEFYDILQSEHDRRQAERWFSSAAGSARIGILDVGAGTGVITEMLLDRSAAPIHAIEPNPAMRVALMTRVAGLSADRRARVSVYADTLDACHLEEIADLAICANMAGTLEPADRRALWRAVAAALTPDGVVLLDTPVATVPKSPHEESLPPVRVGPDIYTARCRSEADRGLLRLTYTYRVERDGRLVREEQETFTIWPATRMQLQAELCEAGLEPDSESGNSSAPLIRARKVVTGRDGLSTGHI